MGYREYLLDRYFSEVKVKKLIVIVLLSLLSKSSVYCQSRPGVKEEIDSNRVELLDSLRSVSAKDTAVKKPSIPISNDAIKDEISYKVPDSVIYNYREKLTKFYGKNVELYYQDISIKAPEVIYDQDSSILTAIGRKDSSMLKEDYPTFTQDKESFTFGVVRYNFDSKRALITDARSQYNEGFIISEQTKRNKDETIYGFHNQYTTCSHEDPHFSIYSDKIKIIPNRVVVSGPARLQVAGVPTPLILPMAMFPLSKGQRSGFILPTYDLSPRQGVGLKDMGYYFAISDNMDLQINASIYSYGSWTMRARTGYNKRYRYSGNFSFSLASTVLSSDYSLETDEARTYGLSWSHSVNPNRMRGYKFGASVNFNSPSFYRNTSYNNQQFLQNSTNSQITLSKSWAGTPFSFSANLSHSQNNSTRQMDLKLPSLVFNVRQQFPFQKKISSINKKWYEKVAFSYRFSAENNLSFIDSALDLSNSNSYEFRNTMNHTIPITASYKAFKYFSINPSFNYKEYWNTKKSTLSLDPNTNTIDTTVQSGFYASRNFNTGVELNTILYGMFKSKSKNLKAVRHQMTPGIGFSYQPDFTEDKWNTYYSTKLDTADESASVLSYFSESGGNFGGKGNSGSITFRLQNTIQAKVRDRKNGGVKKVSWIDQLGFSTSYNLIAEEFKLAPLTYNMGTKIMKNIGLQIRGSFTPYEYDPATSSNIDEYRWENGKTWLRLTTNTISLSGSINSKMFTGSEEDKSQASEYLYTDYLNYYIDYDIPWTFGVSITGTTNRVYNDTISRFENKHNLNLRINGDFNLTPRWKFTYSTGYNFDTKELTFTDFNIYRDLHCWELKMGVTPFGQRRSFNLSLNVKASVLQDLRIVRRRDFIDNF